MTRGNSHAKRNHSNGGKSLRQLNTQVLPLAGDIPELHIAVSCRRILRDYSSTFALLYQTSTGHHKLFWQAESETFLPQGKRPASFVTALCS